VLLLLTALLIGGGLLIGYVYARTGETDLTSAMLATMPGGVGIMASVAADYGRHASLVALVQAGRIAVVVAFISFLVGAPLGGSEGGLGPIFDLHGFLADEIEALLLVSALLATCIVVPIASYLRIPVAALTGAMMVGVAYSTLVPAFSRGVILAPPEMLDVVGQMLLGVTIGEYLGRKLGLSPRSIAYGSVAIAATVAVGLVAALIAAQLTDWGWLTSVLVTAPGGAPEMIVLALALQQDVEIVTTGQILRQLAINGLLPFWIMLFRVMESRYRHKHSH
jgi:membrane AbrB-like protein